MDQHFRVKLYRDMLRIRLVEERIADLYPAQKMRCPVHLSIGQEAPAVGVCAALAREDVVLSGHRSHAHFLAKGGSLRGMMAEIWGKADGCAGGKGGSMHLVDVEAGFLGATPIVGSTIPIAVGAAYGYAMRGENRAAVAFFGDAATEEGVFHESVNFAVLKNLPVLFVCENNLYSVYSPLDVRQPAGRTMTGLAAGHGIETREADGNDVEAVFRETAAAVAKGRRGDGPTFLQFNTYRWREHCGPNYDNQLGYRTEAEFLDWKTRCPIARAESVLLASGLVDAAGIRDIRAGIDREIDDAVAFAEQSPFPLPESLLEDIYAA